MGDPQKILLQILTNGPRNVYKFSHLYRIGDYVLKFGNIRDQRSRIRAGLFFTPDPGSRIGDKFFTDPGSRIQPLFL
jgi:hypothetical protein